MSRIMRELVAEGRAARGITSDPTPDAPVHSVTDDPPPGIGDWPFPGNTPVPVGPAAVCIHGIGMFDRCYACGRWGGAIDGDGEELA